MTCKLCVVQIENGNFVFNSSLKHLSVPENEKPFVYEDFKRITYLVHPDTPDEVAKQAMVKAFQERISYEIKGLEILSEKILEC